MASREAFAVSHEDSSHEDARKYYPLRALIMYEEAQALNVVPKFYTKKDSVYDIRAFPPAAAEVAVLTLLRVFRRYADSHAGEGDVDLPTVTFRVLSEPDDEPESDDESEPEEAVYASGDQRLARTGNRVVVLLRRLRLNYSGGVSHGHLELSGNVIKRWLKAAASPSETTHGMESSLAGALQDQARSIRSQSMTAGDDWGSLSSWTGKGGGGRGGAGGRGSAGLGRGLGSGSSVDFFGAADQRYSADSGDDDDDGGSGYRQPPRRCVLHTRALTPPLRPYALTLTPSHPHTLTPLHLHAITPLRPHTLYPKS
jgi:hypothetical protein